MTGSTLYRRLADGSWAAEREDGPPEPAALGAAPAAQPAGAGSTRSGPSPRTARPAPPSPPAGRAAPNAKRRLRPLRIALALVLAYVLWLVALAVYASVSLNKTPAASANPVDNTAGTTWLLVGSDSREGLTKEEQSQLTTGSEEGQRTDTIMLVHFGGGDDPTLVSVPRDSWVTIPAHASSGGDQVPARRGKINAAFAYGGAPLLVETVEYNTGLNIDHYGEIGFSGIVDMTDAVGGIEVCFDKAITDEKSGLDVEAGCQTLDGPQALAWVRMRYADPKGDLGRIERQQQYVATMADQVLSWQTVVNPLRQLAIVNGALGSFTIDEGSGPLSLARFGLVMAKIAGGSAEVTTIPTSDTDHWEGGQWVLKWDPEKADELFASMGGRTAQASTQQ